jgi:hypothetical protein
MVCVHPFIIAHTHSRELREEERAAIHTHTSRVIRLIHESHTHIIITHTHTQTHTAAAFARAEQIAKYKTLKG